MAERKPKIKDRRQVKTRSIICGGVVIDSNVIIEQLSSQMKLEQSEAL